MNQVVDAAYAIIDRHEEGAEIDAGFDAGEFSGSAHATACDDEFQQGQAAIYERSAADDGPHGRIV